MSPVSPPSAWTFTIPAYTKPSDSAADVAPNTAELGPIICPEAANGNALSDTDLAHARAWARTDLLTPPGGGSIWGRTVTQDSRCTFATIDASLRAGCSVFGIPSTPGTWLYSQSLTVDADWGFLILHGTCAFYNQYFDGQGQLHDDERFTGRHDTIIGLATFPVYGNVPVTAVGMTTAPTPVPSPTPPTDPDTAPPPRTARTMR